MPLCRKCGEELPAVAFHKGRSICKSCHNKSGRKAENTAAQWDRYKEKMRLRQDHVVRAVGDEGDWEDFCD